MKSKHNKIRQIQNTANFHIKDCPVLIPKENMQMFTSLQKACETTPFCTTTFGNQYISKKEDK